MPDTIKEFTVGLGFKIDTGGQQRFQQGIAQSAKTTTDLAKQLDAVGKSLTQLGQSFQQAAAEPMNKYAQGAKRVSDWTETLRKSTVELGRISLFTASAFAKGIEQVTKNYQQLYYSAQQAGTSAEQLAALEAGFRGVGRSGDEAAGMVTSMTLAIKESGGGLDTYIKSLTGVGAGAGTAQDRMKQFDALMDYMAKQTGPRGEALRAQISQIFHWGLAQTDAFLNNRQLIQEVRDDYKKVVAEAGVNVDELAKNSARFQATLTETGNRLSMAWSQTTQTLLPILQPLAEELNNLLDIGLKWEKANPWAGVAATFLGMAAGMKAAAAAGKALLGMVGLGGGGAAGGAAATAGKLVPGGVLPGIAMIGGAVAGGQALAGDVQTRMQKTGEGWLRAGAETLLLPEWLQEKIAPGSTPERHPRSLGSLWRAGRRQAGEWQEPGEDRPQFQGGGIVTADLHAGEMVLPPALSSGLQDLVASSGSQSGPLRRMGDWVSGVGGVVPKVQIDNSDELARSMQQAGLAPGGAVGGGGRPAPGVAGGGPGQGLPLPGDMAKPGAAGAGDPRGLIPVIQAAAKRYGIDPDIAVRVAKSEGLAKFSGDRGTSFGAFQLHTGGGLGDEFHRETGLDPSDPKNEQAMIYWSMRKVRSTGWGPWHGAGKIGVKGMAGIGAMPSGMTVGGAASQFTGGTSGGAEGAVDTALRMQGMNEHSDRATIKSFLKSGGMALDPATAAWCAAYVNANLQMHGIKGSGSAVATSFGKWGQGVNPAETKRGDVVVEMKGRGIGQTGGHVGLATGLERMVQGHLQLQMIAGNTSDAVKKMWVDVDRENALVRRATAREALDRPLGGEQVADSGGGGKAGDKNVTMNVQHTVNINGPTNGTPGEHVRAWAGASKRHFADLHRNFQTAVS